MDRVSLALVLLQRMHIHAMIWFRVVHLFSALFRYDASGKKQPEPKFRGCTLLCLTCRPVCCDCLETCCTCHGPVCCACCKHAKTKSAVDAQEVCATTPPPPLPVTLGDAPYMANTAGQCHALSGCHMANTAVLRVRLHLQHVRKSLFGLQLPQVRVHLHVVPALLPELRLLLRAETYDGRAL